MAAIDKASTSRPPGRLGRPPRGSEGEVTLRILAAAKPVFLREGFEATSLDVIAASAGMSKKTIYARFSASISGEPANAADTPGISRPWLITQST